MKKEQKSEKVLPINVYDDTQMVASGIRPKLLKSRDKSLWSKTHHEREEWKKVRRVLIPKGNWSAPEKFEFKGRLTVHAKNENKTTYSFNCKKSEINYLVSKFKSPIKVLWNGKDLSSEYLH